MSLKISCLGSLEVLVDGARVGPGPESAKPLTLLAVLALRPNTVHSKDALIDDLWDDPPATARNLVEKYVSLWRKSLPPDRLRTVGRGYQLHLSDDELDVATLTVYMREARALTDQGRADLAGDKLRQAMQMWRGSDVADFARALLPTAEADRLIDLHVATVESWAEHVLTSGVSGSDATAGLDVVEHLRRLLVAHPYRERVAELLMWALAQRGEHASAAEVYLRTRRNLVRELGQEPGSPLRTMHTRVLADDPALAARVAPLGAAAVNLPPSGRSFIGRHEALGAVTDAFADSKQPTPAAVAIWGPVGVGKTALALEHVTRRLDDLDVAWFVPACNQASITQALDALAVKLSVPLPSDPNLRLEPLWRALARRAPWLIVFDDARDPADLTPYWPTALGGNVLITSLNPDWGRMARTVPLPVMSQVDTITFLHQRTPAVDGDPTDHLTLARQLDGLPLACEQATAYMRQTGMTIGEYVRLFRRRHAQLLDRGAPDDHRGTIDTTWRLALAELGAVSPPAVQLLQLCAQLAPASISIELLRRGSAALPHELRSALNDDLEVEDAIGHARRYSLLTREQNVLSMHVLLQAVVTGAQPRSGVVAWRTRAVHLLSANAPTTTPPYVGDDRWSLLVNHLGAVTASWPESSAPAEHDPSDLATLIALVQRGSEYLVARGAFTDALELLERVAHLADTHGLTDDLSQVQTLVQLGELLERSGELDRALWAHRRAIELLKPVGQPGAALLARASAGLGSIFSCHDGVRLWGTESLPEAQTQFADALDVLRTTMGAQHPTVALCLSGLGVVQQDSGDLVGAATSYLDAIAILEHQYGSEHLDVAHLYDKLGYCLGLQGQVEQALENHHRALQTIAAALGQQHPDCAWPLSNMGHLLLNVGRIEQARDYQARAHAIFAQALGDAVPTHLTGWRLARTYLAADEPVAALDLLTTAVAGLRAALGAEHGDVVAATLDLDRAQYLTSRTAEGA